MQNKQPLLEVMFDNKIDYKKLNSKQKEIYNFQKVSGILADYGFTTIKLTDDWLGADFIAIKFDGEIYLKVQLKGRLTFDKKYIGKDLYICFYDEVWYLYKHDELLIQFEDEIKETISWANNGLYHYPTISKINKLRLEQYIIN